MRCKICSNNGDNKTYQVREMMLGYRDTHEYFQCSACGCLQLANVPENIQDYYPKDYYSYSAVNFPKGIKKALLAYRDYYEVTGRGLLGRLLALKSPENKLQTLRPAGVDRESRILDVGCGAGHLLYSLKQAGFKHLRGADPFNEGDIEYDNGLKIYKQTLAEVDGAWDLIMMHHSFEHVADQRETLQAAAERLSSGGICLVRIPTVSSWAWVNYGVDWVQLDAPRHLFLHSLESMEHLATQAGLKLDRVVYDSFALQFWGSEQYKQDIPLHDPRSYAVDPAHSIFSARQIKEYAKRSSELNQLHKGDQAAFYLSKA